MHDYLLFLTVRFERTAPGGNHTYGLEIFIQLKNEEIEKDWTETMENVRTRLISCYNCPMKCGATVTPPGRVSCARSPWPRPMQIAHGGRFPSGSPV